LIEGWKKNNPDYEYHYYSDKDVENFIIEHYGTEWHQRFLSAEYPVMKADIFRILVIYKYGGFYIDLDMKSLKPIDVINKENTLACIGAHLPGIFLHPFFGFTAKHPIMEHLLESLAKSIDNNKLKDFEDPEYIVHQKHFKDNLGLRDRLVVRYVMDVSGPLWWSEEIIKFLKLDASKDILEVYAGNVSDESKEIMSKNGVEVFLDDPETSVYFNFYGGTNNFYGNGYESWHGSY
jgi:hypothetical protein